MDGSPELRPRPGPPRHPSHAGALERSPRQRAVVRAVRLARRGGGAAARRLGRGAAVHARSVRARHRRAQPPVLARGGRHRPVSQLARAGAARDGLRRGFHRRIVHAARGDEVHRRVALGPRQGGPVGDRLRRMRDELLAVHPGLRARRWRLDAREPARHPARAAAPGPAAPRAARADRPVPPPGRLDHRLTPRRLGPPARGHVRDGGHRRPGARRERLHRGVRLAPPTPRAGRLRDRDTVDDPLCPGGATDSLTTLCIVLDETRTHAEGKGANMAGVTEVTDTTFVAEVIEADTPVLVDFWAPWCGPCRVVAPVLEEIAGERDDAKVVKLNTDEKQQTTAQYEVLSIATPSMFKDGEVAKKVIGAYPKRKLEAELEPVLA